MANYNSSSMWAGALGEALDAGQTYTFALQTFAYPSQSVYANTAYFMVDSSTATNENLKRSSINPIVGSLYANQFIPLSNPTPPITTTVIDTFIFDVSGDLQGSRATLAVTSSGSIGNGVLTDFRVVATGSDFISGDVLTISQNDLQAAGFANANKGAIFDLFPDRIDGASVSSNFAGTFLDFTNDISQSNFVSSSDGFSFNITQVPSIPQPLGEFKFIPANDIPANSYLIKASGHFVLTIT